MHTYLPRTRGDGTLEWVVVFSDTVGTRVMKSFAGEDEAAAYVSYLNGGAAAAPVTSTQEAPLVP